MARSADDVRLDMASYLICRRGRHNRGLVLLSNATQVTNESIARTAAQDNFTTLSLSVKLRHALGKFAFVSWMGF